MFRHTLLETHDMKVETSDWKLNLLQATQDAIFVAIKDEILVVDSVSFAILQRVDTNVFTSQSQESFGINQITIGSVREKKFLVAVGDIGVVLVFPLNNSLPNNSLPDSSEIIGLSPIIYDNGGVSTWGCDLNHYLAFSDNSFKITMVDLSTNEKSILREHLHNIPCVKFSDDASLLISCSIGKNAIVWDVVKKEILYQIELDAWGWSGIALQLNQIHKVHHGSKEWKSVKNDPDYDCEIEQVFNANQQDSISDDDDDKSVSSFGSAISNESKAHDTFNGPIDYAGESDWIDTSSSSSDGESVAFELGLGETIGSGHAIFVGTNGSANFFSLDRSDFEHSVFDPTSTYPDYSGMDRLSLTIWLPEPFSLLIVASQAGRVAFLSLLESRGKVGVSRELILDVGSIIYGLSCVSISPSSKRLYILRKDGKIAVYKLWKDEAGHGLDLL